MKNKLLRAILSVTGLIGSVASIVGLIYAITISEKVSVLNVTDSKIDVIVSALADKMYVERININMAISNDDYRNDEDSGDADVGDALSISEFDCDLRRGEETDGSVFHEDTSLSTQTMPNPYYLVEITVRNIDSEEKEFAKDTRARVGDTLEYQIYFANSTTATMNNVVVRSLLPDNMNYLPDSTVIYNTNHLYGSRNTNNTICTDGINIGNYLPHANAYVRFRAKVVDRDLVDGINKLYVWGQIGINTTTFQEYSVITVDTRHY